MGKLKTNKYHWGMVVTTVGLFILFVAYLEPFLLIIINAFKTKKNIIRDPLALVDPNGPNFDNFVKAFEKMDFIKSFGNSLLITSLSVTLIIVLASMTAYLFVRANTKSTNILFALMITSMIVPFQAIMIPLVTIYGDVFGILNSRITLILMHTGFSLSMAVFIYHGFIKTNIPLSIEEAALLDGCSRFQTFFKIVFPLLKPITATIVVLNVLAIWNDFLLPSLVLRKKELFTLPLATYSFYGTYSADYGTIMAALVLTTIPVIIVYIVLQKYIISGVVSGSVKG